MTTIAKQDSSTLVPTPATRRGDSMEAVGITGGLRASAAASDQESAPPILIGGVLQAYSSKNPYMSLSGAGYDAFTVTVPLGSSEVLMHHSDHYEDPGYGQRGWKSVEQRMCMAGYCWRKYNPHQSSKRWGLDYESWEYKGATSRHPINLLSGKPCKPTRIDYAFDFNVDDWLYPQHIESMIVEYAEARGFTVIHKGQRDTYTLYIGTKQSERMIRIYRRDLKDPMLEAEGFCILRVELELSGDYAQAYWSLLEREGHEAAQRAAAAHIADMIGYAPVETDGELPELLRTDEDTHAVQMLLQFVKQNAVMLEACSVVGVDLASLARAKIDRHQDNRMQNSRLQRKVQTMALMDTDRLQKQVESML